MITLNTRHGIAEAIRLTIAGKAYDLSEALQSQVLRLMFIKDYQALGRSRRATIGELKEQFNVDTAQAYQDYAVAKKYLLQEKRDAR